MSRLQGIANRYAGGDGHWVVTLTGPGTILLQSMPQVLQEMVNRQMPVRNRRESTMGLMGKVKSQASPLADKAQEGAKVGQECLIQMQSKRQSDALLLELGGPTYLARPGPGARRPVPTPASKSSSPRWERSRRPTAPSR